MVLKNHKRIFGRNNIWIKIAYFIKYQPGFCPIFSTDSCLLQPKTFITRNGQKHMILFDLIKTFHTALQFNKTWNVLVLRSQSLNALNISQTEIFLWHQMFDVFSHARPRNCGVTQGPMDLSYISRYISRYKDIYVSIYLYTSKALKNKLHTVQNKCIRFCLKLPPRSHLSPSHFRKINWLPVERRVELYT